MMGMVKVKPPQAFVMDSNVTENWKLLSKSGEIIQLLLI